MDLIDAMEDGKQDKAESIVKKIEKLRSDYTVALYAREALEQEKTYKRS
ncbi:hypothetical protein [Staphylococcus warneri]